MQLPQREILQLQFGVYRPCLIIIWLDISAAGMEKVLSTFPTFHIFVFWLILRNYYYNTGQKNCGALCAHTILKPVVIAFIQHVLTSFSVAQATLHRIASNDILQDGLSH